MLVPIQTNSIRELPGDRISKRFLPGVEPRIDPPKWE